MRIQTSFLGTLTLATLSLASTAHAEEVSTTGKGIVGGALLGSEVVLVTEAAFKVQPAWAYVVGGVGGAAAGGVGGYFIEQDANPKTTMLMLGVGMALVIPTTVFVLSATAYQPPANYTQDRAPGDEPVAEPPQPNGAATPAAAPSPTTTSPSGNEVTAPTEAPPPAPAPATPPTSSLRKRNSHAHDSRTLPLDYHLSPPALIGVSSDALTLAVPAVEVRNVYSRKELSLYGVNQATEFRVPVLNVLF
ncbi:MAG TPA: hypothetical protein VER96_20600 [Polyangiaceae bacterium]|nr:hypothetical protein [Polyangiaceae bacterium]